MKGHPGRMEIRLTLLLLLSSLAAGARTRGATGPQGEPNEFFSPAALISRMMSTAGKGGNSVESLPPEDIMRRLWRNRVSSPVPEENVQTQIDLGQLIRRVRSVRFDAREQPDTTQSPVGSMEETGTSTASAPGMTTNGTVAPVAAASALPVRPLSAETSETLRRLLADPDQAHDPLETAELLFLSGRPREAAAFYEKALALATGDSHAAKDDRAWILLQLGNCLRETDTTKAKAMYAKLVTEYPESPWVELAKAHGQLILWHEKVQPRQWIARPQPK